MKDFREIVKENKKRALSIAVATAFLVSGPFGIAGCYNPQEKQKEEEEGNVSSGGGYHGGWNSFSGGSSG